MAKQKILNFGFLLLERFVLSITLILLLGVGSFSLGQTSNSGKNDFDFYIGNWCVENKRKSDDGSWVRFTAIVEVQKTLNGFGNVDFFRANINGKHFEGMTIRQFDEEKNKWRIRWYDSDAPLEEPTPSIGKFENGKGLFYKKLVTESGREVTIRFYWYEINKNSFKWESGWSVNGKDWNPTWKMKFKRIRAKNLKGNETADSELSTCEDAKSKQGKIQLYFDQIREEKK